MSQNNLLNILNIELEGELIIKGLSLPFLFRASDIKSYSKNIINETVNLKSENRYLSDVNFIKENFLKYINIERIDFKGGDIDGIGMALDNFYSINRNDTFRLKDTDSLYNFFDIIGVNDVDYLSIANYVHNNTIKIKNEIVETIHLEMENGRKDEHLSDGYMLVQSILEFSSSMVFHENKGLTGDMWSFRERLIRRCYLSRKYESEGYMRERIKAESKG